MEERKSKKDLRKKKSNDSSKIGSDLDFHCQKIIEVRKIMIEREKARKNADFAKSDSLREKLNLMGVEVKDQKDGPSGWRFKDGSSNKLPPGTKVPIEAVREKRIEEVEESSKPNESKKRKADDILPQKSKVERSQSPEQQRNKEILNSVPKLAANQSPTTKNIQGVLIEDLKIGTGPVAQSGHRIKVNYIGRLKSNDKVFDSSLKKPFGFRLGKGEVIRGWDIGCAGMMVGGKRRLTIPPEKAYGKGGAPPTIPGNATLVFEVTLLEIR